MKVVPGQENTGTGKSVRLAMFVQDCGLEVVQLATNYASDYLDYVENLPFDLQRNVTKLREIDQKCREYVKEMEGLYESFIKENDNATTGTGIVRRRSYLHQIRRLYGLCKELGDEKISVVQIISEAIESRNKQSEHVYKRFKYAYEPNIKTDHNGKREKDSKADSARGNKRSRRQRNNNSAEIREKSQQYKDNEKPAKSLCYDDTEEPPSKVTLPSASPEQSTSGGSSTPALTRAALRDEDKRITNRSTKDSKEEKLDKDYGRTSITTASGKPVNDVMLPVTESSAVVASPTSAVLSTTKSKGGSSASTATFSTASKANNKGKKKKRKSNKHQTERQTNNSGEFSPIDVPIDPDEPTYCLCQQVSFGQMIGCDNPKCPIEWFHFSCVRLTHKPKGKWYCPDCTIKRRREGKRTDTR